MSEMLRSKLINCWKTNPSVLHYRKMNTNSGPTSFFLGSGQRLEKSEFLDKIRYSTAKVICVGENHEDATAHKLELDILKATKSDNSNFALSLEFYDRESQTVLNEYLQGIIPIETFLTDGKPPGNHTDYQSLIDFCKEGNLEVIAANCPRRYTRLVGKHGKDFLNQLKNTPAANLLPPLPYTGASTAYRNNFLAIMEKMGNTNPNVPTSMLDAQSLWDATMAHSIAEGLVRGLEKIVHITGYFHIQHRLGTIEHIERYAPGTDILTVVILPAEQLDSLNEEQLNIGDLVALTDINAL